MRISAINDRFERVIKHSFGQCLLARGYQQEGNQFYVKADRVGKLLTIKRDPDPVPYRHVTIFTIGVEIISDDFWEVSHPGQALPSFPFQGYHYSSLSRHLGQFFGKNRGSQWLALDVTIPEQMMTRYLRDLLQTRILPYLDGFNSIDDILKEYSRLGAFHARMLLLAHLGRKEEAREELKKLIASRHQLGFRMNMVKVAQQLGII